MTEVNKYRLWCDTESTYVYQWAESEPTTCPNNTGHTIDTTKTTIDEVMEENVVEIKEENTPTGGFYRSTGVAFDAPAGEETNYDFSFPYPISLLSATFPTEDLNAGDVIDFNISPDTIVGAITSDVAVDDTVINVQSSVIANMDVGKCCKLDDGTNNEKYTVVSIDEDNNTLTLSQAVTNAYAAATPTYIKLSVCMVYGIEVSSASRIVLGESKIGGSYIPANTTFRWSYTNNGGSQVRVRAYLEFLY